MARDFFERRFAKTLPLLLIFCVSFFSSNAQKPVGYFLTDSIEIGRPFRFGFSFRHRPEVEVFFPDTTHNFGPFEVLRHEYFPTETNRAGSLDSAIYTLVTFDVAKVQTLRLPVWILTARDCTAVYSVTDSVYLKELVKNLDEPLRIDDNVVRLQRKTNFPLVLLVLLLLILGATSIYLLFGEAIQRQWRLYQLYSRNREFSRNYNLLLRNLAGKDKIESVEQATLLWKRYLQRLEKKPFITYTTKEITDNLPNESLANALREIDSLIYGSTASGNVNAARSLGVLREVATDLYRLRRLEIAQSGKTRAQKPDVD